MNAVIGMTNLLLDTSLNPEQARYMDALRNSADHLLFVINEILDISKIESGRMELVETEFNLKQCLTQALDVLTWRADQKGLAFEFEVSRDCPETLVGDPGRLRQMLLNIIGNAINFTEKGKVGLTVRPLRKDRDDVLMEFVITDSGRGIPVDKQNEVFEPFVQSPESKVENHGGTGLGLTITKKLAVLMGGGIRLRSVVDQGSAFYLTARFGLAESHDDVETADESIIHSCAFAGVEPELFEKLRILVAEDNQINQLLARRFLEKRGHEVEVADNGLEALGKLNERDFDLVLMDIQMPGMDGLEATAEIRRMEENTGRHLPIVAMTAFAMAADREMCLEAGMDAHLAKPISPQSLYQTIEEAMKNSRS